MIAAADLERRLRDLLPIGADRDGTTRLAWTREDAATARWFEAQARPLGLAVERDPAGNLWATPSSDPPWWALGSHLDSVRDGGAFDGALGVAIAFEVAARAGRPIAVLSFADEEGARFNTPTFGSRALVGRLDPDSLLERCDADGIPLREAVRGAGLEPGGIAGAAEWLPRLRGFLEAHIDQSRDVVEAGAALGIVSRLAARMRLEVELCGTADHVGTTPLAGRRDALLGAAELIVAAADTARDGADDGLVVTASRILAEPNALTTIPRRVRVWMDARAATPDAVSAWEQRFAPHADALRARGLRVKLRTASRSAGVEFDASLRGALTGASDGLDLAAVETPCFAGHDAGILAERIPAAMVLVRNERGVSHAADEHVELSDAAHAANVLLRTVEELA